MNAEAEAVDQQPAERAHEGDMEELSSRLAFTRKLQQVTNKVHSTRDIDEIMLDVSRDICALFEADRLTIYMVNEEDNCLISKIKTGLDTFGVIKLPLSPQSIAGYVAVYRRVVNISDVYNTEELRKYSPQIAFNKAVDKRTGYRTKQMLVGPILDADGARLLGVIQLINSLSGLRFPTMAEEGVGELAKTLAIAFKQRQQPERLLRSKYGTLVANGKIASGELDLAVREARRKAVTLEDLLVQDYGITLDDLGRSYAAFFGVPYEPFKSDRLRPTDILGNIKREFAQNNMWVPLEESSEGLVILTPEPDAVSGSKIVNTVFPKHRLIYKVCTQREFHQTLDHFYGEAADGTSIDSLVLSLNEQGEEEADDFADDLQAAEDNELVQLVNKIIIDGFRKKASDIHIEPAPGKEKTLVRFRIDGDLMNYIEIPATYRAPLVTRLKIMCDLDIAEKRKPQDGKIKFKKFAPLDIELRVATVPTVGGLEDVVMRILASGEPLPLEKLGLSERNRKSVQEIVSKPYGLFFVCGPTGSGKTTTLHSILKYINTPDTKIWTAEDPVEITQKGLRQVQMNPKAGLTFATAMRAFLRADPDVIMVGEMRDKETVSTGIEASLTGHLVFSTLHTNSAPESIIRLLDMGMDPFNFSDALLGVLAQRLSKRLCSSCKKPHPATPEEIKDLLTEYCYELKATEAWRKDPKAAYEKVLEEWRKNFADEKGQFTLYSPEGCDECNGTGYRGRMGLHELLVGTDAVKKRIQEHSRVAEIVATALEEGMRTLKQDGIEKVLQGVTDIRQVRAVCIK